MFQLFGTSTEQVILNSIPFTPEPAIEYCPFKCKRCPRSFSSTQALGGHQSTHRREKEKSKAKKQQKASLKSKKNRAKPQSNKPKKSKPKTPSARHLELKLTLDEPRRKNKKMKNMANEVSCWSGLCSRCNEEVASSWIEDVEKFTFNSMDIELVDQNFPQKKIINEEKEWKNDQPLDLSLKL